MPRLPTSRRTTLRSLEFCPPFPLKVSACVNKRYWRKAKATVDRHVSLPSPVTELYLREQVGMRTLERVAD
jgi:hypothetical protein